MATTPTRSLPPSVGDRVSPYPTRIRTPVQRSSPPAPVRPQPPPQPPTGSESTTATEANDRPVQVTLRFDDAGAGSSAEAPASLPPSLYQIVVRPIVKSTVGQRDTSGTQLNDVIFTGSSFADILRQIWGQYSNRIKGRAVRDGNDVWSVQDAAIEEWHLVMQFKVKKKVVDSSKSEQEWRQWMVKRRGETVSLLLFEYGMGIHRQQEHDQFTTAVIQPEHLDRAGATAERTLREVVAELQARWSSTFEAEHVVWRMWANHVTSNLNRSTWEQAVARDPPVYVANLLRPVGSRFRQHISGVRRTGLVALDVVNSSIAEQQQLTRDLQALLQRVNAVTENLASRKSVFEAFMHDMMPPTSQAVADPLGQIDNVQDFEHEE